MGPEALGQFSYFLSLILYLAAADSLCHESIVKQAISQSKNPGPILGSASLLSAFLSLASCLIITAIGLFSIADSMLLAAFLWFLPGQINKPLNPIAYYFDVKLMSKLSSLALFSGALVSTIFRVIGVNLTQNLAIQSFGYSLQTIIYGLVLYLFYKWKVSEISWSYSFSVIKDIIKKSFPLFLSTILYLSLSQSDIFMIKHILGVREVGLYSVVVRFSEPWVIVSSALCTTYFALVFAEKANTRKQNKYFIRANWLSNLFVVLLGLVLMLMMPWIVDILLGKPFEEVTSVFYIYYWSIIFLFYANIQHIWEVFHQHYSISLQKIIVACVIKVLLNLLLGPWLGLHGFAISSLLALGFYGFGFNFFSAVTKPYLSLQLKSFTPWQFQVMFRWLRKRLKR